MLILWNLFLGNSDLYSWEIFSANIVSSISSPQSAMATKWFTICLTGDVYVTCSEGTYVKLRNTGTSSSLHDFRRRPVTNPDQLCIDNPRPLPPRQRSFSPSLLRKFSPSLRKRIVMRPQKTSDSEVDEKCGSCGFSVQEGDSFCVRIRGVLYHRSCFKCAR